MRIKTTLASFFFLAFSSVTFCQDYRKEIETQFLTYNDLIIQKEFNKSMDFIPEEFFEIIPRAQMILLMEKIMSYPEMEFELKRPQNIEAATPQEIDGKFYSIVKYSHTVNMKFKHDENAAETKTEQKRRIGTAKAALEQAFGPGNVKYNKSTGFYEVTAQKQAVAISSEKLNWKFLVMGDNQKAILNRLLPKEIADQF